MHGWIWCEGCVTALFLSSKSKSKSARTNDEQWASKGIWIEQVDWIEWKRTRTIRTSTYRMKWMESQIERKWTFQWFKNSYQIIVWMSIATCTGDTVPSTQRAIYGRTTLTSDRPFHLLFLFVFILFIRFEMRFLKDVLERQGNFIPRTSFGL